MEHIIKQLKRGAKNTRLSSVEKAEMRSALVSYAKANPIYISRRATPSPFNISNLRNKKGISILVIGGLLMGGTVSFASESTLPGDTLYPVKVHVNEKLRGAVSVSTKKKAEWDVRLVERRLEEVEKLAVSPNVNPEIQNKAKANLERYTERAKERIARLEKDDDRSEAVTTASDLASVLRNHEDVLDELNEKKKANKESKTQVVISNEMVNELPNLENLEDDPKNEAQPLEQVIMKVREERNHAEKKYNELERKYHKSNNKEGNESRKTRDKQVLVDQPPVQENRDITTSSSVIDYHNNERIKERKESIKTHEDD